MIFTFDEELENTIHPDYATKLIQLSDD